MRRYFKFCVLLIGLSGGAGCSYAQESDGLAENAGPEITPEIIEENTPPVTLMTPERMAELVSSFDAEAKIGANGMSFTLAEREVLIVYDLKASRMRIVSPIAPSSLLDEALLMRMSQANFDAVLDARYAVADGLLWSTFIHPLGSLHQEDFTSAIAQVVTAAETFGTSYTSGAMVFGGGDTSGLHDELLKELEEAAKKTGDPI